MSSQGLMKVAKTMQIDTKIKSAEDKMLSQRKQNMK